MGILKTKRLCSKLGGIKERTSSRAAAAAGQRPVLQVGKDGDVKAIRWEVLVGELLTFFCY